MTKTSLQAVTQAATKSIPADMSYLGANDKEIIRLGIEKTGPR